MHDEGLQKPLACIRLAVKLLRTSLLHSHGKIEQRQLGLHTAELTIEQTMKPTTHDTPPLAYTHLGTRSFRASRNTVKFY
jgi:hypothetical protein